VTGAKAGLAADNQALMIQGDIGSWWNVVNPLTTPMSPAPLWLRSESLFVSAAGPISFLGEA
jgi:hypothetical protein